MTTYDAEKWSDKPKAFATKLPRATSIESQRVYQQGHFAKAFARLLMGCSFI